MCRKDRGHLQKFLEAIDSNIEIKDRINKFKGEEYQSSRITVCCPKLCYDLISLKCIPRKTYSLEFPSDNIVPKKFKRDFLRGFFDGDGCISITQDNKHIEVVITGIYDMLDSISSYLISEKIIRVKPKIYSDKRSKACNFYIYGTDNVKEFLDYLYKGSNQYLDRKYSKYIDFYKNYDYKEQKRRIYFSKQSKKYIATISVNNKKRCVGAFENIDDAIAARKQAEIEKMNLLNKLPT